MNKDRQLSNPEREFLQSSLEAKLREDSRQINEFRQVKLNFVKGNWGQVEVLLGRTRVLAKVSASVTLPYPDKPTEGILQFSSEIHPLAHTSYEPGKISEPEVIITRMLERSFRRSKAIDMEGLCIVAGEKVWTLRVDLHFLDDDGNLMDAASIAALAALRHFKYPDVTVIGEEVTIHSMDEKPPISLTIHHPIITISFGIFSQGELAIVDCTSTEEQVRQGNIVIAMNPHQQIIAMTKLGGVNCSPFQLWGCIETAKIRVAEIQDLIKQSIN